MRLAVHWQILIALALAVLAGLVLDADGAVGGTVVPVLDFVGKMFLNALKMIIVPLIVASIIIGIGNLGAGKLGALGGKTLLYYLATSSLAIIAGLFLVNLIQPGLVGDGIPAKEVLGLHEDTGQITEKVAGRSGADVIAVFLRMIPTNIVAAAAEGQMLGLIFFSLLFGYFMERVFKGGRDTLHTFWQGVQEVMMKITNLIMLFAPIGVFALVGKVVITSGLEVFIPLASFFFTVLGALALHMFVILPLLMRAFGISPLRHFRAMLAALLTAFSTSSSSATLPVTLDCVRSRAGVSNRVGSFVLPLGATVNMDGTALYECVAVLFLAQAYGLDLSAAQQATVVVLALMTSIGVAGIPAASLVAIVLILGVVGLPAEAVGLILAVDRLLDMCRTSVNVFGDSSGAVVIARSEGEETAVRA
ncbi:MAG: dicarboxylate/amino acid:cation symporter [Gammaproteobacteria bacterium]|nr:dicarboxylate/amino acid:cation symporter [Gammaproteobacteria bacterium]